MLAVKETIDDKMEQWARWRQYRAGNDLGWPKRDSIGRAMSGMPGTGCPTCGGKGQADGARVGAKAQHITCPTCGGSGRVKMDPDPKKANPAFIRSTAPQVELDDKQSQAIDWIVATVLTEECRNIVKDEYTRAGTQTQKAARRGIQQYHYSRLLTKSLRIIADELNAGSA